MCRIECRATLSPMRWGLCLGERALAAGWFACGPGGDPRRRRGAKTMRRPDDMHTRASAIRTMAAAAVMALAASAGGCGGGHSPPPNCLQVQPCGGDVVGNWSFLGACVDVQAQSADFDLSCPGAKVNATGISLTGTLNFNADFTYTATNWTRGLRGQRDHSAVMLGHGELHGAQRYRDRYVERIDGNGHDRLLGHHDVRLPRQRLADPDLGLRQPTRRRARR